ncbi:hypothetical protein [Desulfoluna sp.]|uniref:hypothetical protein n=1 Tax=Desulfoluna sp. TaxID=2045199 RepID=UPI002615EF3A|nr:hypothetical protein [Desulfoluna sp.]
MELLMVAACVQGGLVYAAYRLADSGRVPLNMGTLVAVALLVRLPFVFASPLLSDDIHRYLFDGRVQQAGESPYAFSPKAYPTTDPIVSDLAAKVNHPGLVTLYPPGAQLFFRLAAPFGLIGMKGLLVTADMVGVGLLLFFLTRQGLPGSRAVLYAWNPLVIWEIAWSGHIDALALPFLLGAGMWATGTGRRQVALAGGLFALAFWVKLMPVIFIPFFLFAARRRVGWFVAGGAVASMFLVVPYLPHSGNAFKTLWLYGSTWEFSGFLFCLFRDLTGMNLAARLATAVLFCCGAGGVLYRQWRTGLSLFECLGWAASFWLLTTPTLHPWYGLYLALFLPLMGGAARDIIAPYLLTLTPLLGYGVLTNFLARGVWDEGVWIPFWIFFIPVCAWVVGWHRATGEKSKSKPPAAR